MHNIPQDSVPCKIRAKRGCATHPRSIAERVIILPFSFYFYFRVDIIYTYLPTNSIELHVCRREELE
jgi:hypothetical protein